LRTNIAVAGGPCTGKSVLTAALFARLKELGLDFDLIAEEGMKLRKEFGGCRNPFDRFYLWIQQEREELRSTAKNGFITDAPLFHLYAHARYHASEPRDTLATRELFRMCLERLDRYQLIVVLKNPGEIGYKKDGARKGDKKRAREIHRDIVTFIEHHMPKKLLFVNGNIRSRVNQVLRALKKMKRI